MKNNDEEQDFAEIGFRKSTGDKLTYKINISNAIENCRRCKGFIGAYENAVSGLIDTVYFNMRTSKKLKDQIDEIIQRLDKEREEKWNERKNNTERWIFYKRGNLAKFRNQLDKGYWEAIYREIKQVLANEGLLLEEENIVPIRFKRDTKGFVDESDEFREDSEI